MNQKMIKPVVLVEYDREAYVHPMGNVQTFFDKNLRSGGSRIDLFHPSPCTIPVHSSEQMILEVKFDGFLPAFLRKVLSQQLTAPQTISKYYLCRQNSFLGKRTMNIEQLVQQLFDPNAQAIQPLDAFR